MTANQYEAFDFLIRACLAKHDDCILWPFTKHGKGYGHVRWHGRVRKASRVVCILVHGDPPSSKHEAAHDPIKCNNPSCVNPNHIRWVLPGENSADRKRSGTWAHGEKAGRARLTEAIVREIRQDPRDAGEISRELGMSKSAIVHARTYKTWKHVL